MAPETGVILAALSAATDVVPTVIGKPERWIFDAALAQLSLTPAQALMVGDRLDTDICGARQIGMQTALVTSGVDQAMDIQTKGIHPDLVAGHLGELMKVWEQGPDPAQRELRPIWTRNAAS